MNRRVARVEKLISGELSNLIHQQLAENYGLITITRVIVTADFKLARIYISVFDQTKENDIIKQLNNLRINFQKVLSRKIAMRSTPKLEFCLDENFANIEKVEQILEEIDHGA